MKKTKPRPTPTKRVSIAADVLLRMHNAVECFLDDCNELPSYAGTRNLIANSLEERLRPFFYSEAWQGAVGLAKRLKTQGKATQ